VVCIKTEMSNMSDSFYILEMSNMSDSFYILNMILPKIKLLKTILNGKYTVHNQIKLCLSHNIFTVKPQRVWLPLPIRDRQKCVGSRRLEIVW